MELGIDTDNVEILEIAIQSQALFEQYDEAPSNNQVEDIYENLYPNVA